jgi:putative membrane protein
VGVIKGLGISWAANAIVLLVITIVLSGATSENAKDLLIAAALFGVLNTILKPILRLLTLPFAVITLGLVWFFVSMLMLAITSAIVSGFEIHGFWTYVWATVIAWFVNVVLDFVPGPWRGSRRN